MLRRQCSRMGQASLWQTVAFVAISLNLSSRAFFAFWEWFNIVALIFRCFRHKGTNLFRNKQTFSLKNLEKDLHTYINIENLLIVCSLYYVGCLHKMIHTYIKLEDFVVIQHILHIIWLNYRYFRLTYHLRKNYFPKGKTFFRVGKYSFGCVMWCWTTFLMVHRARKRVVFWVKIGELAEWFFLCRQPT